MIGAFPEGEQALSCQSPGGALAACELGNFPLWGNFLTERGLYRARRWRVVRRMSATGLRESPYFRKFINKNGSFLPRAKFRLSILSAAEGATLFQPPLCKGRCLAEGKTEGLLTLPTRFCRFSPYYNLPCVRGEQVLP